MKKALSAVFVLIAGCANPGIVQISPDTYMLSRTDKGGVFGNAFAMKAEVINKANAFAKKQGEVAIPISTNEAPMQIGRFASFDYQFGLVDPDSAEARATALVPKPDVVIEKTSKETVDVHTKDESARPKDVYGELLNMDDLRKRGILSEAEFEAQKRSWTASNLHAIKAI